MIETILVIISISILILAHEFGHFCAAKMFGIGVEEFGFGFPPRLFAKKIRGTEYSINALPFGGFVRMLGEDGDNVEKQSESKIQEASKSFSRQSATKKIIVLVSGVFLNIVCGWILFSAVFMIGTPSYLIVSGVADSSPSSNAGIVPNDIIIKAISGARSIEEPMTADDFIGFVTSVQEETIDLTVRRGEENVSVSLNGRVNPPRGEGSLGLSLSTTGADKKNIFTSLYYGGKEMISAFVFIAGSFIDLIAKIFTSPEAVKNVSGPIGIIMIAKQASNLGFVFFIQLMAVISVDLAVLNLIPFPALDGGRIVLAFFEKIKGRSLSLKIQTLINGVGFLLLIALMILVSIQDISKYF